MATGAEPAEGHLGDIWRAVVAAGEEMHILSLLIFTMTLLVLQAGLLARINYLHGQPYG